MAQRQKEKKPAVTDEESAEAGSEPEEGSEDALARVEDESEDSPEHDASDEGDSNKAVDELAANAEAEAEGEGQEELAAAQLGSERYVLAGFFVAGMLGAFVTGRAIQALWTGVSNKDWFSTRVPLLAAVADEDKSTISLLIGAVIALIVVIRTYRKPEVRTWTDDVAGELAKVKWPTRKEVWNSTVIVIAATAVSTIYLALLDRLWEFLTTIVYGNGS